MSAQRRHGFDAWLHTVPQLRWKPRFNAPRRRAVVRVSYYHPVTAVIVGFVKLYAYFFIAMMVFCVWAAPLVIWLYEVIFWGCVWAYYGMFLGARWIYRNNIIGQAVSSLMRRRAAAAAPAPSQYRPDTVPPLPAALDADPYDTDRARTRS